MNEQTALQTSANAALPTKPVAQLGFADLLGVGAENNGIIAKDKLGKDKDGNKVKRGVSYCLLPANSKDKESYKSKFGVSAAAAKTLRFQDMRDLTTKGTALLTGAVASGKMLISKLDVNARGEITAKFVNSPVVMLQAPVDLAAVKAYLAAHPEEAKTLAIA